MPTQRLLLVLLPAKLPGMFGMLSKACSKATAPKACAELGCCAVVLQSRKTDRGVCKVQAVCAGIV